MMGKRKKEEQDKKEHKASEAGSVNDQVNGNAEGTAGVPAGEETAVAAEQASQSPDPLEQVAAMQDKYLRLYSEFDNYRKRTIKEKIELSKSASAELIVKLLPVLDDFERALKAFDAAPDAGQALKDGTLLIYNKFNNILTLQGLEQMQTSGVLFDTDFHEAITNIPAPSEEMKGKIVDEIEKGYLLNGKVIRYAKVVVGS